MAPAVSRNEDDLQKQTHQLKTELQFVQNALRLQTIDLEANVRWAVIQQLLLDLRTQRLEDREAGVQDREEAVSLREEAVRDLEKVVRRNLRIDTGAFAARRWFRPVTGYLANNTVKVGCRTDTSPVPWTGGNSAYKMEAGVVCSQVGTLTKPILDQGVDGRSSMIVKVLKADIVDLRSGNLEDAETQDLPEECHVRYDEQDYPGETINAEDQGLEGDTGESQPPAHDNIHQAAEEIGEPGLHDDVQDIEEDTAKSAMHEKGQEIQQDIPKPQTLDGMRSNSHTRVNTKGNSVDQALGDVNFFLQWLEAKTQPTVNPVPANVPPSGTTRDEGLLVDIDSNGKDDEVGHEVAHGLADGTVRPPDAEVQVSDVGKEKPDPEPVIVQKQSSEFLQESGRMDRAAILSKHASFAPRNNTSKAELKPKKPTFSLKRYLEHRQHASAVVRSMTAVENLIVKDTSPARPQLHPHASFKTIIAKPEGYGSGSILGGVKKNSSTHIPNNLSQDQITRDDGQEAAETVQQSEKNITISAKDGANHTASSLETLAPWKMHEQRKLISNRRPQPISRPVCTHSEAREHRYTRSILLQARHQSDEPPLQALLASLGTVPGVLRIKGDISWTLTTGETLTNATAYTMVAKHLHYGHQSLLKQLKSRRIMIITGRDDVATDIFGIVRGLGYVDDTAIMLFNGSTKDNHSNGRMFRGFDRNLLICTTPFAEQFLEVDVRHILILRMKTKRSREIIRKLVSTIERLKSTGEDSIEVKFLFTKEEEQLIHAVQDQLRELKATVTLETV